MRVLACLLILFLAVEPTLASVQSKRLNWLSQMSGMLSLHSKIRSFVGVGQDSFTFPISPVNFGSGGLIALAVFVIVIMLAAAVVTAVSGYKCVVHVSKVKSGETRQTAASCFVVFVCSMILGIILVIVLSNTTVVYYRSFVPICLLLLSWTVTGITSYKCFLDEKRRARRANRARNFLDYLDGGHPSNANAPWTIWRCTLGMVVMAGIVVAVLLSMASAGATGQLYQSCHVNKGFYCVDGASCDISSIVCYHSPRWVDEPCGSDTCINGTTCLPFLLICVDGQCGSPCLNDADCQGSLICRYVDNGDNPAGTRICVVPGVSDMTEALSQCLTNTTYVTKYEKWNGTLPTRYSTWEQFPICRAAILNQGCCGSCVLFATSSQMAAKQCISDAISGYEKYNLPNSNPYWVGNVSQAIIYHRTHSGLFRGPRYVRFSEQYLMQCVDASQWASGGQPVSWNTCQGSNDQVAHAVIRTQGLPPYSTMAYQEGDYYWLSQVCDTDALNSATCVASPYNMVKGCTDTAINSFEDAMKYIVNYGPITGSLNAITVGFEDTSVYFFYNQHVLSASSAGTDHQVMIFGYGNDDGEYLMVRNQWGSSFGFYGEVKVSYSSFAELRTCIPKDFGV